MTFGGWGCFWTQVARYPIIYNTKRALWPRRLDETLICALKPHTVSTERLFLYLKPYNLNLGILNPKTYD